MRESRQPRSRETEAAPGISGAFRRTPADRGAVTDTLPLRLNAAIVRTVTKASNQHQTNQKLYMQLHSQPLKTPLLVLITFQERTKYDLLHFCFLDAQIMLVTFSSPTIFLILSDTNKQRDRQMNSSRDAGKTPTV